MTEGQLWIDAAEAAARLGVKPATLYSYVSRGRLARRRQGHERRSLFNSSEIDQLRRRTERPRVDGRQLAFESAVTALGADRPFYRGRDALRLAQSCSFEQVAELLWSGTQTTDRPVWRALPFAVNAASRAQRAQSADALPLDRLQLIVTTLAVSDPMRFNLDPLAVAATGRTLIAGMVDSLPFLGARRLSNRASIVDRLWPKLTSQPATSALLRVVDAALIVLADHELAASTVAARVAASVKADPYAVVSAALGVVGAPMHGGAALGAERMLGRIEKSGRTAMVIGERLRSGQAIPGIGHTVYAAEDARATFLLAMLREAAPGDARLRVVDAVLDELSLRGLAPVNVDFAVAAISFVSQMVTGSAQLIFAVARTAGWLAHTLEEYTLDRRVRPRALYVGPPPDIVR